MQIVIDIPEKDYKDICESAKLLGDRNINYWERKVAKGIPLQKCHGRLIDADAVLEDPIGNTYKDIDIAETIVEADKEVEE